MGDAGDKGTGDSPVIHSKQSNQRTTTKASGAVPLVIVPVIAAAAMAMGCGSGAQPPQRTCIDNGRTVVDQKLCEEVDQKQRGASGSFDSGAGNNGGGVGYVPMYHWYYYPHGMIMPRIGGLAPVGGSYSPTTNVSTPTGGIVRGGFGSTATGTVGA